jgi:alpha/beta superfamily hydrolase
MLSTITCHRHNSHNSLVSLGFSFGSFVASNRKLHLGAIIIGVLTGGRLNASVGWCWWKDSNVIHVKETPAKEGLIQELKSASVHAQITCQNQVHVL